MRRTLAALLAVCTLAVLGADAQVPSTLPANTVVGRLGIGSGPGQAIPLSVLSANVSSLLGLLSNARVGKTANYTTTTADCGSTFALGGNSFFVLSFAAASGYAAACSFRVTNEDAVRMKFLSINGFAGPGGTTGFFICPGATELVLNDNGTWVSTGPHRCLTAPSVYISTAGGGGVDWQGGTNDCLATGAGCITPQKAYDFISTYFDLGNGRATILVDSGTYTLTSGVTFLSMLGPLVGGARQGAQGTWLSVVLGGTINVVNANLIACDQGCSVVVSGISATINLTGGSGNQGNCFIADNGGILQIGAGLTCVGNNGTPANHVAQANINSNISCTSGITISGTFNNALFSVNANSNFTCDSQTIVFGAATTATSLIDARNTSYSEFQTNTITNPGSLTGAQYNVLGNSYADMTGTTMPGTAGSLSAGGRVKTAAGILAAQDDVVASTVALLPTCNTAAKGQRRAVTDANATTFHSTAAGGGANNMGVICDGTNWYLD